MEKKFQFISCCGKYYCTLCSYYKGTIVEAAKNLLPFAENIGSLRLMANAYRTCDYDEFLKGLKWIAANDEPCKGCRFGGGWSWWGDCPVRDCTMEKKINFCFQCDEFPCEKLQTEPLLDRKKAIIKANEKLKDMKLEKWLEELKKKYS